MEAHLVDEYFTLNEDNLLVEELSDDIVFNGIRTMYDADNPYMFCRVVDSSIDKYVKGDILVIKRYAKEEFISGYYFISPKDVRTKVNYYEELVSN